ncbi:MAG: chromosome segregation protein SMC [Candidatus Loosdrechtia sp.]|uniref:chromosome segregation protein SMC n=1 Tax=Candidatus Loosdrechtia sp. TaxID=3101272 RepID=UPI003A622A25|nr:MAG: chromosome segregation protein SMC [Candidatus Jettenia sp. AMX2]
MKLKKLELFGFKSFAEKTEITFEDGITVIVGPNGCGKSNVIDAIKWVLGEQSVKSLRGNEMVDVIFNGTDKRPSLGYAEVSLTIQNTKGLLPLEYTEVCITRRLYTSGESEYLINKQASRLKDIRELFIDTGFGANAYSVIEQGNVEALLQADAGERRLLFEEAAGISKFKVRKKAALSKLEHVEQNLLRVGDIIEELRKQLRSVKLQASKARKYQEYAEQLKRLKIGLSLRNYRDLREKKTAVSEQVSHGEEQNQKILTVIHELETQRCEIEDVLEQSGQQLAQLQTEIISLETQTSKNQEKIKYDHERIKELEIQRTKYSAQHEHLKNKADEISTKITETKGLLDTLEQEICKLTDTQKIKETAQKQMNLECDLLYQGIDEKKSEVITVLQKESNLQNEIGSLTAEKDTLQNRRIRLLKRQEEITSFLDSLLSRYRENTKEKEALMEEFTDIEQNLSASRVRIQELMTMIRSLDEQINQQKQLKSSKISRHEVLMDYEMRSEGVEAGATTILEESKKDSAALKGIRGMVGDLLKVDLMYAQAIEAALGDKVQGIITDTTDTAVHAITFLQENQKGYAVFLPLDKIHDHPFISEEILQEPGVVGIAGRLIHGTEEACKAVHGFLNNTIVVKDLQVAMTLSKYASGARYVTLDGKLLEPEGTLSGGKKQGQVGIISRKSELTKIEEELIQIQQTLERLEQDKEYHTDELARLEGEASQFAKRLEQVNILKVSKDNELAQNEQKQDELTAEKKINENEVEEIDVAIENTCAREKVLQDELRLLNQQRRQIEQQVEEASILVKEKEYLRKSTQDEITSLKVGLAQRQEKRDGLNKVLNKLSAELTEVQEQRKHAVIESQRCSQKKVETEEEIKYLELQAHELQTKKVALEESMAALRSRREEYDLRFEELKELLEEKQAEQKHIEQKLQELRLRENEYHIRISHLEERVREDYRLELSDLDATTGEIHLELSTVPDKSENESDPQVTFWDAVSGEIEELQGKIERLGNVNLEAIKEQDELEIRETFLANQKEDLETSHNALQDLIKKINQTSRELFEKTFSEIRQNFQAMFRKLFGGGKADILLEENADILEASIEIVVQPPNKELRSITLLSGGEKVMITVALLFAVFQTKPSPFCILDEVDAALDESNITRFSHIVKEFTRDTQFLIITHNKVTMSIADVMYGITMQEPGVSKKIAVKFEEIERKVA